MAQSFEGKLLEASSAEVLKAAKQLLKSSRLACAYRDETGSINAVFQEGNHYAHTVVQLGEPPTAVCSCGNHGDSLCAHAVASIMYCGRFRSTEIAPINDGVARYAGIKDESLESLAGRGTAPAEAQLFIQAESDFPHVPSKWENVALTVKLRAGNRDYVGNVNNLRQLYFDKALAITLKLNQFSLQDRQIIHFLAVNAEAENSQLLLNSEVTAEFFHSLIGFDRFSRNGRRLIVHREHAEPVVLKKRIGNEVMLSPGIVVGGAPLSIHSAKVIVGRSGCWIGRQGEYWWMPATLDIGWLRNFFRTGEQKRQYNEYQKLIADGGFPVRLLDVESFEPEKKPCTVLLSGNLSLENGLRLKTNYLYDNVIYPADHGRLSRDGRKFWLRDEEMEQSFANELKMFGFAEHGAELQLDDSETIGVFLDQVLPMWLTQRPNCCLTAELARLCRGGSGLPGAMMQCTLAKTLSDRYVLNYQLECYGQGIGFQQALKAVKNHRRYLQLANNHMALLDESFGNFLLAAENVIQKVDEKKMTFELPRCAVHYWKHIARNTPEVIPEEFQLLASPGAAAPQELPDPPAAEFKGELRGYQQEGVNWMRQLLDNSFNVVLADEMGLGKTVQLLALLAGRKTKKDAPILIICPASLVENWKRECGKFVPGFRVAVLNCGGRDEIWQHAMDYDLIVGSYSITRLDAEVLKSLKFSYLILDEAQHIKNPNTANAQNCKAIRADHRLVLTGTPLENSSEDLWSIFDFLHPGLLGSFNSFKKYYGNLRDNPALQQDLAARVTPFIKRRTKAHVCQELPPKQEYTLMCEMEVEQRRLYDEILRHGREQLKALPKNDNRANFEILTTLLRLRQVCCHPDLLPEAGKNVVSAKFELLKELINQHIDSGNKMLLFSQFTSLLSLIRDWLDAEGIRYEYLDGATRNRQQRVDSFNNTPEIPLFLLSLKAGGTGLNLTSADTVIIFDPWWNPAVELQAADRTHRIGQTKPVTSIKLLVKDSIEEKILALQDKKQEIFDNIIENPAANADKLSLEELKFLFQ